MDVLATIGGALAAADAALELVNAKSESAAAELQDRLADLKLQLVGVNDQVLELMEERRRLSVENAGLEAELQKVRSKVEGGHRDGAWYKPGDSVPYCGVCRARDNRFTQLIELSGQGRHKARWQCPSCMATSGMPTPALPWLINV